MPSPGAEIPAGEVPWPMPEEVEKMPDFEAEGLLEGLEGEAREARIRLLEYLIVSGIPLKAIKAEADEDRLALLPADLVLGRRRRSMTPREIADESGLSLEDFQRLIVAFGFPKPDPDQRSFGRDDLAAARRLRTFQEAGIPTESVLTVTRQVGSSAARIAAAHRDLAASEILDPQADEFEAAMTLRDAARELLPISEQAVVYALRAHFLEQMRGDMIAVAEPGWLGVSKGREVSVCFADLVGFTRMGERSELEKIGTVAKLLESVAIEVTNPEVHLVKLIGDAAMLVSDDGEAMFDAALRFIEVGEDAGDELPALRVGVARGKAIPQAGDWFGHPVNLASRITEAARPGSVLASAEAVQAGGDGFSYSSAGRHRFKGLDSAVGLYRVRRLTDQ